MIKLTANKGEWSELYAFFKILVERKISAASDKNLNISDKKYDFLQIFRENEFDENLRFDIESSNSILIFDNQNKLIKEVVLSDLPNKIKQVFREIKENSNKGTFASKTAIELMNKFLLEKIKAKSKEKSDLIAIIRDEIVKRSPEIGFSIKSQIGSPSTLLNAGKTTNFIFNVNNYSENIETINETTGKSKIRDRLREIIAKNGELEFCDNFNHIFAKNLRMIDSLLPEIIASMLIDFYSGKASTIKDLCLLTGGKKLFGLGEKEVEYKVKSFLRVVALGMVPATEWNTRLSSYGGYIVVREDGELVCYYLYNDDDFRDFLFENTKFDTASSSRHDFGKIYIQDSRLRLNLNLQIRFTR